MLVFDEQHSLASSAPCHSSTFSCGAFDLLINWHNQREVAAAVLIPDLGRVYDESKPTKLTQSTGKQFRIAIKYSSQFQTRFLLTALTATLHHWRNDTFDPPVKVWRDPR